jgi:hypothetical protein
MNDDFATKVFIATWAAIAGGLVSFITTLILGTLAPRIKRSNLTRRIKVYVEAIHGQHIRCRVYNGGYWTIGQAILYISVEFDSADILPPPAGQDAFIRPDHAVGLTGDQLVWSVRSPEVNPMKVDIYAKERQPFSPYGLHGDMIMIPSEHGWDFPKEGVRIARVFLKKKTYFGALKIVSADTNARYFNIEIQPDDVDKPIVISPVWKWRCKFQV